MKGHDVNSWLLWLLGRCLGREVCDSKQPLCSKCASVQGTVLFQNNPPPPQMLHRKSLLSLMQFLFLKASSYSYIACFSVAKLDNIESHFHSVCRESPCHARHRLHSMRQSGSPFLSGKSICLLSMQTALFLSTSYIRSGLFLEPHKQRWAISSLVI